MGFLSNLASTISSGFSAACGAVSSALSSVGSMATRVATSLGGVIAKGLSTVSAVSAVVDIVAKVLGLLQPNEKIEEIGEKVIIASDDGLIPDNYDSFAQYYQALKDYQPGAERLEKYNFDDDNMKIASHIAGISVISQGLSEHYGVSSDQVIKLCQFTAIDAGYFNAERFQAILENGLDVDKIDGYFANELTSAEDNFIEGQLLNMEQHLSPEQTQQTLAQMRQQINQPQGEKTI